MKIKIINKPMLCWNDDEYKAKEYHVLAKVTECVTDYPFKVISNENTYLNCPNLAEGWTGKGCGFKNIKPIPEVAEMTVTEISKLLGKTIKIIE